MRIYDFRMDEILLLVTTEKVNYTLSINQIVQVELYPQHLLLYLEYILENYRVLTFMCIWIINRNATWCYSE